LTIEGGGAFHLRRYQEQGVVFLSDGPSRLLADEMGLGKTVQVAVALDRLRQAGGLRRALIVAPSSLLLNWQRELARFGPRCAVRTTLDLTEEDRRWLYRLPVPITVASYESVRSDFLVEPPDVAFDVVVFDEAQRLKNRDSVTAIATRRIRSDRRWLLSATPLENRIGDLGSLAEIMRLLEPRHVDDPIRVTEALQGAFFRRRKVDVLPELPPLIHQEIPLLMEGAQRLEHDVLAEAASSDGTVADLLALITRMKQVCNRGSNGDSVKLDALHVLLEDAAEEHFKFIVISQYTDTLHWLSDVLDLRTLLFTGDMSQRERDETLTAFRAAQGSAVLLLSLKAGGVGLNIQEATHVVMFDRWWTPAAEQQAVARAHRFGRTLPLLVYSFRVVDSVEDRIVTIAAHKLGLFEEIVEERLTSSAADTGWTRRDLLRVLHPLVD
jgi:SNF2 family DNA or RNA helicase